ncbi:hypothetical protein DMUE_5717 [Dictyocoela muelleri]|nr:hypothetical protein DMUE_5717 [Dictyocoela muelleri]
MSRTLDFKRFLLSFVYKISGACKFYELNMFLVRKTNKSKKKKNLYTPHMISIIEKIFNDINGCMNFIIGNNIVESQKMCIKCYNITLLKIYTRDANKHIGFRCKTAK